MWSHYANSHSGYCVGLDRDILFDICEAQLSMVTYDNIFPEVGMFEEGPIALIKLTTTKSENWKYEEEIRMVKFTPRK